MLMGYPFPVVPNCFPSHLEKLALSWISFFLRTQMARVLPRSPNATVMGMTTMSMNILKSSKSRLSQDEDEAGSIAVPLGAEGAIVL